MTYLNKHINRVRQGQQDRLEDQIAVEEPLQIFIRHAGDSISNSRSYVVTMRTPGRDADLIRGHLYCEQIISSKEDLVEMSSRSIVDRAVHVQLKSHIDLDRLFGERSQTQSSACGVCGKSSLDFMDRVGPYFHRPERPSIPSSLFNHMLRVLDSQNGIFQLTGGIHAAALFDKNGKLLQLCEDVGRHNAMDKLVGWALDHDLLPLSDHVVLFSGRTSFELIQKAHEAGIPIVASVGAPSSLAIEMAEENGMTLVGFMKPGQYNVYSDDNRIEYVDEKIG